MSDLSHPHIVRAFGYALDEHSTLHLLVELCDGNLDDLVPPPFTRYLYLLLSLDTTRRCTLTQS